MSASRSLITIRTRALVIDPVLVYSTYLGGSGTDQPSGHCRRWRRQRYVTGYTDSADFPLSTTGFTSDPHESRFRGQAGCNRIESGVCRLHRRQQSGLRCRPGMWTAPTTSTWPAAPSPTTFLLVKAFQSQQPGPYSGFLTKLSADGSSLLYSTYLGGSTLDQPTSLAIDSLNEAVIRGLHDVAELPDGECLSVDCTGEPGQLVRQLRFRDQVQHRRIVTGLLDLSGWQFERRPGLRHSLHGPPPTTRSVQWTVDTNGNAYVARHDQHL